MRRAWIAVYFWLRFGLQWRDQYAKFGLRTAWSMAGDILSFRRYLRGHDLVIVRMASSSERGPSELQAEKESK